MRVRVASHGFADVILERDFEVEWAEILGAISALQMPIRRQGTRPWSLLRTELVQFLTHRAWTPDVPLRAWYRAQRPVELLHVDLEKHSVTVMVATSGRDMFGDLFTLNVAATGRDAEVGVYVVASAAIVEADRDPVPTIEDVALPLSYRLGGMSLPIAVVGVQPDRSHSSAAADAPRRVA